MCILKLSELFKVKYVTNKKLQNVILFLTSWIIGSRSERLTSKLKIVIYLSYTTLLQQQHPENKASASSICLTTLEPENTRSETSTSTLQT